MNGYTFLAVLGFSLRHFAQPYTAVWTLAIGVSCALGGFGVCLALEERKARVRRARKVVGR